MSFSSKKIRRGTLVRSLLVDYAHNYSEKCEVKKHVASLTIQAISRAQTGNTSKVDPRFTVEVPHSFSIPVSTMSAARETDRLLPNSEGYQVNEVIEVGNTKLFVHLFIDSVPGESEF